MSGFTGIPGQTRAGAQAYADQLARAHRQGKLALQRISPPKKKGDNFWSAGKQAAPKIWGELRQSFDQKAQQAARTWDQGSATSFWSWLALGDAIGYWSLAELSKIAPYLAKVGPDSWGTAALDILSLGSGAITIEALKGLARGARGMKIAKDAKKTRVLEAFLKESAEAGEVAIRGSGKARQVRAMGRWKNVPAPSRVRQGVGTAIDSLGKAVGKHASLWGNQYVRLGRQVAGKTIRGVRSQGQPPPQAPAAGPPQVTAPRPKPAAPRARPGAPKPGSPGRMGQGLNPHARPGTPQPGSLRWMAQGLNPRARPGAPKPGSLRWMGQGLNPHARPGAPQPGSLGRMGGSLSPRARPTSPKPGSLGWMAKGLR